MLLAALAMLSACGGSDPAESTVTTFLGAIADGDGSTACRQLTAQARQLLARQVGESSCEPAVTAIAGLLKPKDKDLLHAAQVSVVHKSKLGKGARENTPGAGALVPGIASPDAIAQVKGGDAVPLVKENGDWRIEAFTPDAAQLGSAAAEGAGGSGTSAVWLFAVPAAVLALAAVLWVRFGRQRRRRSAD